jgi:hypothetical protein
MCQGKGLYISISLEGMPDMVIRIAKESKKVETLEVAPEIYSELGDRKLNIKVFNKKDRIIYSS